MSWGAILLMAWGYIWTPAFFAGLACVWAWRLSSRIDRLEAQISELDRHTGMSRERTAHIRRVHEIAREHGLM